MRISFFVYLLVSAITLQAFAELPKSFDATTRSEHVVAYFRNDETKIDEAKNIVVTAEKHFAKISNFLGKDKTPSEVTIYLEGEAFNTKTQEFKYPSVDDDGIIHLFHFPGEAFSYAEAMPHEMVHAFRTHTWKEKHDQDYLTGFGFIEEGFAEFVSMEVSPEYVSFVRYGYPVEAVVAFLFEDKKDIPLGVLFNHHEINPKCIAQAYPLRASFFKYLNITFGKEKVFALAYYSGKLTRATFGEIFGKSFEDLVTEWKSFAVESYQKLPNGPKLKDDYKNKSPVKHFPFCEAGKEW
jgi:hypothetical protein